MKASPLALDSTFAGVNSSFIASAGYELLLAFIITVQVTDSMLMNASFVYPENTPTTKEAYYYRTIFEKFFPKVQYYSFLVLELLFSKVYSGAGFIYVIAACSFVPL